jgi:uncharacterized SAM-binding protein YcdF (DUF218 family)
MTKATSGPETRAILILGAAVWPGGRASPTLARRTAEGARLWHEGRGTVVVPCGGIGRHPPSEALVMRRLLIEQGVPNDRIHPEDRSTSTAQNIAYAARILETLAIGSVVIVSDAYHLPRARLLARRLGLKVETSAPPSKGARPTTQIKGALREIPAYLAAWLRIRQ